MPSAADLFDSLFSQEERPEEVAVSKKGKKSLPIPKKIKTGKKESKTAASDSEPEECVFLSFDSGNKKGTAPLVVGRKSAPSSVEPSPEKPKTPAKEVKATPESSASAPEEKEDVKDPA